MWGARNADMRGGVFLWEKMYWVGKANGLGVDRDWGVDWGGKGKWLGSGSLRVQRVKRSKVFE